MTTIKNADKAEQDLQSALLKAKKVLGATTPRLLTGRPQIEANSLRHGLTGQTVFLTPAQLHEYLAIGAALVMEFRPTTISECLLTQHIIDTEWRFASAQALATLLNTSTVVLESQALYEANPHLAHAAPDSIETELVHTHAQALAIQRQCEGANTLEKLGRHETRLQRSRRSLRADYQVLHHQTTPAAPWTPETSPFYLWYNQLAELADRLIDAREELIEKSIEEMTPVETLADSATSTNEPDTLLCKKTIRITQPLTRKTSRTLSEARNQSLLTESEETLFPLPEVA